MSRSGRPGWAFPRIRTLSPNPSLRLGERASVRGLEHVDSPTTRFVPTNMKGMTKRLIRDLARKAPHSRRLPPNSREAGHSGGEERIWVEMLTQGGIRGSCPSCGPGLTYDAPSGQFVEAPASCRCTLGKMSNLQGAILRTALLQTRGLAPHSQSDALLAGTHV